MSLVVALDGSDISELVLAAIAPYLRRSGTKAYLLTVIDDSDLESVVVGRAAPDPRAQADLSGGALRVNAGRSAGTVSKRVLTARIREERDQALRDLAAKYLSGLEYEIRIVRSDHAAESITDFARKAKADAIAIGTSGRGRLQRALLGSVADEVIRTSEVPVFVVRRGMRAPQHPEWRAAAGRNT
jgi:nucleotide-binding universal stress UspA family protein